MPRKRTVPETVPGWEPAELRPLAGSGTPSYKDLYDVLNELYSAPVVKAFFDFHERMVLKRDRLRQLPVGQHPED